MLVLALDTATPAVSVGVIELSTEGCTELAARAPVDPRAHTELLVGQISEVLAESGTALADMHALVCGVGPGPFTGLRVGMVTATALGQAADKPVYPVCTLDAIAAAAGPGSPLLVAADARRKELYWASYDAEGARLHGPEVGAPETAAAQSAQRIAGSGIELYPQALAAFTDTGLRFPSPRGLAEVAAAAVLAGAEPEPLTPLYLRRPDATMPGARKRVTR